SPNSVSILPYLISTHFDEINPIQRTTHPTELIGWRYSLRIKLSLKSSQ
ncbi:MAG: hypothetical protein ACI868_001512, partial [Granulosicoccus sp.]